ncbi:histone-lysine N-methyltransferase SETMAR-like [Ptiloglossa arizonensis]|uniref:histone-lysine N-methyltransferase SETMAR-like n=1 Tax=Ptiloglossa arizonensis TaxID=3350558 RepID=UPI003FA14CFF
MNLKKVVQLRIRLKTFAKCDFDLSDEPRSGRPTAFNPEPLKALIEFEPQLTSDEIAERLSGSSSIVRRHLIQLRKVSKLGKRWLSYGRSSLQWPQPGLLRPRKVLSRVYWDIRGIIHFELFKQNQIVTVEIYCQRLERLRAALVEKRPSLANFKGVLFHHDNVRPHTARITVGKIKNFNWELLPHPPYSPDLAPIDYHLFRSMQHFLSGKNFNNCEDVKSALNEYFDSKSERFFENGIRKMTDSYHQKPMLLMG